MSTDITDDAGRWVTYLIQPILPKDQLVETILEAAERSSLLWRRSTTCWTSLSKRM